jgi:methyl-accepting chemotaxis protein
MLEALENARKNVEDLGGALASEKEKRGFFVARSAFLELSQALPPLVETGALAFRAVENARAHGRAIQKIAVELSRFSDRIMLDMGTSTLQGNESAQGQLLILCFAGLLLGIGFATYTSLALARILRKMALYAGDIAAGNFASSIDIREKGEIGAMFQAMRRIPEIFTGVVTRCNVIADYISTGLFRDRLDTSRVSGGFQDLTRSINAIADAYTGAIDNLPVGIITLDAEHKTRFTNSAGGKMVGDDALRAFGGSMPLVDACLHENEIKSAASELTALTGKKLSLAATVLPLRNLAGKTVSGLAVLADITEIREKQALMLEVAGKAAIIADRVAAAAEELAAQVEEISRGAEVQRTRVESTVSAMAEMNSTVAAVAHNASSASDQSRQTRENAVSGSALVNKVVGSINRMNEVAVQLQANMHTLGEQAEGIGTVMNVISDIADQTNLLALNAAIEAARAGEAGRGFAVVADEVRKLAEKTMNATREVGESISAIQSSTRTNIDDVAVAVESVHEATELANSSGEALHDIVNLAESTSSVVSSIAAAADEQSAASEEITQAVGEINRLVTETTEGMLQSSEAVQDLSRIAQELRRVMEELK